MYTEATELPEDLSKLNSTKRKKVEFHTSEKAKEKFNYYFSQNKPKSTYLPWLRNHFK